MYRYKNLGKQHIVAALEKVGHGRKDKNGYPIEIDFNELPMLVHMRSAVPGPRTPFFVCELEDGTRLASIFFHSLTYSVSSGIRHPIFYSGYNPTNQ